MVKSLLKTMLLLCALMVGSGSTGAADIDDTINNSATSSGLSNTISTTWATNFSINGASGATYYIHSMGTKNTSNALQWNSNGFLYATASGGKLKSITITGTSGKSIDVFAKNSAYSAAPTGTAVTTMSLTGSAVTYTFTGDYSYIALKGKASSTSIVSIVITYTPTHTLTYSASNGSIGGVVYNTSTAVATGASVIEGGKVTLTAEPAAGYQFDSWSVEGTGSSLSSTTENPTTFTMGTANATVTANFVVSGTPVKYSVTYDANDATSGSVPTDDNEYDADAEVTVKDNIGSLAKTGNAFSGWNTQADGLGTNYAAGEKFNITANTTLYAKWTPYSITAQSNNTDYGTVELIDNVINATPAEGYTYASPAYTVSSGSATVEQEGDEFTVTPYSDCTVTINFAAIPTHTATFSVNGVTSSSTFYEGQAIEFPSDPADINGKSFVGWLKNSTISGTTNEDPGIVNQSNETMGDSDVTYYAVFADVTHGDETTVTDVLTTSTFGSPSSYTNWSNKQAANGSSAMYAGNSTTYDNTAIQLRATTPSGIVSTESGGKVTKVKVTWNENTAIDRTLDIYGKTTAYSAASDLYNDSNKGTKLGSLYHKVTINNVETTTTELTITGDYQYIGLRSNNNAMYLDEIDIEWTTVTADTYSNYCTTVVDYAENSINDINDSYTVDLANNEFQVDLSGATATSGTAVQFTVLSSTIDANDYDLSNGVLTVSGNGIMTIRAYVDANATYNSAEKIVTVTVVDDPVIGYADETEETAFGTNYTVDEDLIEGGAVSLVSGNTDIATVEGLVITPVAVGSVTITVNTAATDIYHAGSATFTLNITAPEGSETAPISEVVVFEETFAKSTGGPLSTWGGSEANGTLYFDNSGWDASGSGAGECAKFGTSGAAGSATTPSITVEKDKTYSLSFKAAPWSTEESRTITVTVSGGKINDKNVVTTSSMSYKQWNEFCYDIVATATSMTIEFECSANRFFLDDVKLTTNVPVTTTVTLNKYGYATYCSETPIDFSSTTGYTAWRVSSVDADGTITFARITEKIKGGQGVLLYNKDADGVNNSKVTITFADGTREFSASENLLKGTLAPTYVTANEYYGLSGENFVKVNAGTIPAGKALLPASEVPSNARLTFVFEDVQGIKTIEHSPMNIEDGVYNMQGQRVDTPKKGLYIVNGKKVIIK